jgi:hypothetical protein
MRNRLRFRFFYGSRCDRLALVGVNRGGQGNLPSDGCEDYGKHATYVCMSV